MGRDLYDSFAEAKDTFDRVTLAAGIDVCELCFTADEVTLRQTNNAQLALFATSLAAYRSLAAALPKPLRDRIAAMAGHSVGEYAALAAANVISLEDGARLVRRRGELMAQGGRIRPGAMAAVLGLAKEIVNEVCKETPGGVVIANDNCPGQLVISGEVAAVQDVAEALKARGAKRVVPLNVSGAFHSPLMAQPAKKMTEALAHAKFAAGTAAVYSNVTSEPVPLAPDWPSMLERQLTSTVRWTESVEHMRRDGVLTFVECGPGDVLKGLIRRIDKEAAAHSVSDSASLRAAAAELENQTP